MHPTTLFSILLAVMFTRAIPVDPQFPVEWFDRPADTTRAQENEKLIQHVADLATQGFRKLEHVIKNPNDADHMERLKFSFGDNVAAHLPLLETQAAKLTHPNAQVSIGSRLPVAMQNAESIAEAIPLRINGQYQFNADNTLKYSHINLGEKFFDPNVPLDDKVLAFGHEVTHPLLSTEDNVVWSFDNTIVPDKIYEEFVDGKLDKKNEVDIGAGYAMVPKENEPGVDRLVKTSDMNDPITLRNGLTAAGYFDVMNSVSNPVNNADAWRLAMLACASAVRKRALTADDPVGYYLVKRAQCSRPSGDSKAKASTKSYAEVLKGTTTAGKSKATGSAAGSKSLKAAANTVRAANALNKPPKPTTSAAATSKAVVRSKSYADAAKGTSNKATTSKAVGRTSTADRKGPVSKAVPPNASSSTSVSKSSRSSSGANASRSRSTSGQHSSSGGSPNTPRRQSSGSPTSNKSSSSGPRGNGSRSSTLAKQSSGTRAPNVNKSSPNLSRGNGLKSSASVGRSSSPSAPKSNKSSTTGSGGNKSASGRQTSTGSAPKVSTGSGGNRSAPGSQTSSCGAPKSNKSSSTGSGGNRSTSGRQTSSGSAPKSNKANPTGSGGNKAALGRQTSSAGAPKSNKSTPTGSRGNGSTSGRQSSSASAPKVNAPRPNSQKVSAPKSSVRTPNTSTANKAPSKSVSKVAAPLSKPASPRAPTAPATTTTATKKKN